VILVDSSAWIEYDRATATPVDRHLTHLITEGADVATTEPVAMELLAGAKNEQAADRLRNLFASLQWIPVDPYADFEGAARVYRACRSRGVTPRGLIDCMIASIALRAGGRVLAADGDFEQIASVVPLRLEAVDSG
jgi:hypothetical protein